MEKYELLLEDAESSGIDVIENYKFNSANIKGLLCNDTVALSAALHTNAERTCILAEELGHYHTSSGDILDMGITENRKQEQHARAWAYNSLVSISGLIGAYENNCRDIHEIAEYLGITESFLEDALAYYRSKFGICIRACGYIIYTEPLGILKLHV